jgi:hypothetical protein
MSDSALFLTLFAAIVGSGATASREQGGRTMKYDEVDEK